MAAMWWDKELRRRVTRERRAWTQSLPTRHCLIIKSDVYMITAQCAMPAQQGQRRERDKGLACLVAPQPQIGPCLATYLPRRRSLFLHETVDVTGASRYSGCLWLWHKKTSFFMSSTGVRGYISVNLYSRHRVHREPFSATFDHCHTVAVSIKCGDAVIERKWDKKRGQVAVPLRWMLSQSSIIPGSSKNARDL